MEECRMQLLCMLIILLVMLIYFSARRTRTKEHVVFRTMLWIGILNVIFDIGTVYCVNHLAKVPMWITDISHRIFYLCICSFMFLLYLYISRLVEIDFTKNRMLRVILWIPISASMLVPLFLKIEYAQTPHGNYSVGPAVVAVLVVASIYMLVGLGIFVSHIKTISMRKRTIISTALLIEVLVSIYQALVPYMLISSMGITIIILAIFITTENPDRLLMELYNKEKEKAERASETKTEFLANMSHEIRTPINTILGMDEVILREYDDPQIVEYASSIRDAGLTLLTLVNDILDLSKIEMGRIQLVNQEYSFGILLSEVYQMNCVKAKQKRLEYRFVVDETIPCKFCGDDVRIKQVMNNLVSNAIKYTQDGSVVVKVTGETENGLFYLKVVVKDTGMGIRKEDLGRVFLSFERLEMENNRQIEGAGLGLSISKKMVSMMDGQLWVESEYGVGSSFCFKIPQSIVDETPIGNFERQRKHFQRAHEKYSIFFEAPEANILVVDDNEMNLKVVEYLLKVTLVKLDCVVSGEEALKSLEQKDYDLILLDYMMPGMNGYDTLQEIRKRGFEIPVIVLTANAVLGAKEQYLSQGFCDYISKPIEISKLEKTLCKHLPQEKIHYTRPEDDKENEENHKEEEDGYLLPAIEGIDYLRASQYSVSQDGYLRVLNDFLLFLPDKTELLTECCDLINQPSELRRYTIEIHSMKSTLRLIGAQTLSDRAAELEKAGNEGDLEMILQKNPGLMKDLKVLQSNIDKMLSQTQKVEKKQTNMFKLSNLLLEMKEAMERYNTKQADQIMDEIQNYEIPEEYADMIHQIIKDNTNLEYDEAIIRICDLVEKLEEENKA